MNNKKGFISMTLVYTFLILFLFLMLSVLNSYSFKNKYLEAIDDKIKDDINISDLSKAKLINEIIEDNTSQQDSETTGSSVKQFRMCISNLNGTSIDELDNGTFVLHTDDSTFTNVLYSYTLNDTVWNVTSKQENISTPPCTLLDDKVTKNYGDTKGLYYIDNVDENDDGMSSRIYFYRGEVYNNYAIYQSNCYRIMRTIENGDIKLIYSSASSNGTCPSKYEKKLNTIYDETTTVYNNSNVNNSLDNWYLDTFGVGNDKVTDAIYCNSTTMIKSSFNCSGTDNTDRYNWDSYYANGTVDEEKGNMKLKYPVGLVSIPEIYYACQGVKCYLQTGFNYWAMNRASTTEMFYINSSATISNTSPSTTNIYAIPVVTLKSSISINKGDGNPSNPYVISEGK